jgi:hypothetical protein
MIIDVSAIQSQVQVSLQKKSMDLEMVSMQNLLAGMPQAAPLVSEPGKGQNLDIRV